MSDPLGPPLEESDRRKPSAGILSIATSSDGTDLSSPTEQAAPTTLPSVPRPVDSAVTPARRNSLPTRRKSLGAPDQHSPLNVNDLTSPTNSDIASPMAASPLHAQRKVPTLSRPELMMHLPFKAACEAFETKSRDYNEEFQALWADESRMVRQSYTRRRLGELLTTYDEEASHVAKLLVEGSEAMSSNGIRPVPGFPNCYRQGNLFIRRWGDPRLALSQQACIKAMFTAKCPRLHLPLTATVSFCGHVVTVQAMVPLHKDSKRVYRGDGVPDMPKVRPVYDHVRRLLEALNHEVVDISGGAKLPGLEIIEGLDGRWYAVNVIGLVPPLFNDRESGFPKKRLEHVVGSSELMDYHGGVGARYVGMVQAFCSFLPKFTATAHLEQQSKDIARQQKLVELLHYCGLNLALMGTVMTAVLDMEVDEKEVSDSVCSMLAVEMIARSAKAVMFEEMRERRAGCDIEEVQQYLTRTLGALMMDTDVSTRKRFRERLVPSMAKRFTFSDKNYALVRRLEASLVNDRVRIVKRLCNLCGFVLNKGTVESVRPVPSNRNLSSVLKDMTLAESNREFLNEDRDDYLTEEFLVSLGLPMRVSMLVSIGDFPRAISVARQIMSARCNFNKRSFSYFDSIFDTATVLDEAGHFDDAEKLYNRVLESYAKTPLLAEDRQKSFEVRGDVLTFVQGQCDVRCRLGLMRIKQERLLDARRCFTDAVELVKKLPDTSREHSASFILQPYHGLIKIARHPKANNLVDVETLQSNVTMACMRLRPTTTVYKCLEAMGSLLLERGLFEFAAECLRNATEVCRSSYGNVSAELAQALNAVAFVYYSWDVVMYGDLCEELMREGLAITEKVAGKHTMDHLVAINNLGNLLLGRKKWAPASKLFGETLQAPEVVAMAPENQVISSMEASFQMLQIRFRAVAVVRMQQYWRRYQRRKASEAVRQAPAMLVQRIGRAYLSRCGRDANLLTNTSLLEQQLSKTTNTYFSSSLQSSATVSGPILQASKEPNKKARDWNLEFQLLLEKRWSAVDDDSHTSSLRMLREDFQTAAEQAAKATAELIAGTASSVVDDLSATYVPGEQHTYRVNNLIITTELSEDLQWKLLRGYHALFRLRIPFLAMPLCCTVEVEEKRFFVSTLIPRGRDIVTLYREDGEEDGIYNDIAQCGIRRALRILHVRPSFTFERQWKQIGIECIEGGDGRIYVTSALGFVPHSWKLPREAVQSPDAPTSIPEPFDGVPYDPLTVESSDMLTMAPSMVQFDASNMEIPLHVQAWMEADINVDQSLGMVEAEMVNVGKELGRNSIEIAIIQIQYAALLHYARREAEELKSLRQVHERLKDSYPPALLVAKCRLGGAMLDSTGVAQAVTMFTEAAQLGRDLGALSPVYWAPLKLLPFRGLIRCSQERAGDVRLRQSRGYIQYVVHGSWPAQDVLDFLRTYAVELMRTGEYEAAAAAYSEGRRTAKELFGGNSIEYASLMSQEGFVYFNWNLRQHADMTKDLMNEAAAIVAKAAPTSMQLGSMYNNIGCVHMQLREFTSATGMFEQAEKILRQHRAANDGELVKLRKNIQVLKNRVKINGIIRIQSFVRGWRIRRARRLANQGPKLEVPIWFDDDERIARRSIFDLAKAELPDLWWQCRHTSIKRVELLSRISLAQNQQVHRETLSHRFLTLRDRIVRKEALAVQSEVTNAEAQGRADIALDFDTLWLENEEPIRRALVEEEATAAFSSIPTSGINELEFAGRLRIGGERDAGLLSFLVESRFHLAIRDEANRLRFSLEMLILDTEIEMRETIMAECWQTKSELGATFANDGNAIVREQHREAKRKNKEFAVLLDELIHDDEPEGRYSLQRAYDEQIGWIAVEYVMGKELIKVEQEEELEGRALLEADQARGTSQLWALQALSKNLAALSESEISSRGVISGERDDDLVGLKLRFDHSYPGAPSLTSSVRSRDGVASSQRSSVVEATAAAPAADDSQNSGTGSQSPRSLGIGAAPQSEDSKSGSDHTSAAPPPPAAVNPESMAEISTFTIGNSMSAAPHDLPIVSIHSTDDSSRTMEGHEDGKSRGPHAAGSSASNNTSNAGGSFNTSSNVPDGSLNTHAPPKDGSAANSSNSSQKWEGSSRSAVGSTAENSTRDAGGRHDPLSPHDEDDTKQFPVENESPAAAEASNANGDDEDVIRRSSMKDASSHREGAPAAAVEVVANNEDTTPATETAAETSSTETAEQSNRRESAVEEPPKVEESSEKGEAQIDTVDAETEGAQVVNLQAQTDDAVVDGPAGDEPSQRRESAVDSAAEPAAAVELREQEDPSGSTQQAVVDDERPPQDGPQEVASIDVPETGEADAETTATADEVRPADDVAATEPEPAALSATIEASTEPERVATKEKEVEEAAANGEATAAESTRTAESSRKSSVVQQEVQQQDDTTPVATDDATAAEEDEAAADTSAMQPTRTAEEPRRRISVVQELAQDEVNPTPAAEEAAQLTAVADRSEEVAAGEAERLAQPTVDTLEVEKEQMQAEDLSGRAYNSQIMLPEQLKPQEESHRIVDDDEEVLIEEQQPAEPVAAPEPEEEDETAPADEAVVAKTSTASSRRESTKDVGDDRSSHVDNDVAPEEQAASVAPKTEAAEQQVAAQETVADQSSTSMEGGDGEQEASAIKPEASSSETPEETLEASGEAIDDTSSVRSGSSAHAIPTATPVNAELVAAAEAMLAERKIQERLLFTQLRCFGAIGHLQCKEKLQTEDLLRRQLQLAVWHANDPGAVALVEKEDGKTTPPPRRRRRSHSKGRRSSAKVTPSRALPTQLLRFIHSQEMDDRETILSQERSHFAHVVSAIRRAAQIVHERAMMIRRAETMAQLQFEDDTAALEEEESTVRRSLEDDVAFLLERMRRTMRQQHDKIASSTKRGRKKRSKSGKRGGRKGGQHGSASRSPSRQRSESAKQQRLARRGMTPTPTRELAEQSPQPPSGATRGHYARQPVPRPPSMTPGAHSSSSDSLQSPYSSGGAHPTPSPTRNGHHNHHQGSSSPVADGPTLVIRENTVIPSFEGFPCDDPMIALLHYERQLTVIRQGLLVRGQMMQDELNAVSDQRTMAVQAHNHGAWVPSRPGSAHAVDFVDRDGSVVGTAGHHQHPYRGQSPALNGVDARSSSREGFVRQQLPLSRPQSAQQRQMSKRETTWNPSTEVKRMAPSERLAEELLTYAAHGNVAGAVDHQAQQRRQPPRRGPSRNGRRR